MTSQKPILILLTGQSHAGKTTTANLLKSHHTHLVHGDSVIYSLPKWCSDHNCRSIYRDYVQHCKGTDPAGHLNILSDNLDRLGASQFVTQLLKSEYFDTSKEVILMEGYIFGLTQIKQEIYSRLKDTFHIWEMQRM